MNNDPSLKHWPPIAVVTPSSTVPRFLTFEMALADMRVPPKSYLYRIQGASPAKNRNDGIRLGLAATPKPSHFFFLDDDHYFNQDMLVTLLEKRVEVVCALTTLAMPEFHPVLFKGEHIAEGKKWYEPIAWAELDGRKGLYQVFAGPGSGLLVERGVLERMRQPWFEIGRYSTESLQEDVVFYEKCRDLGIPVYCDLDAMMGHLTYIGAHPYMAEDGRYSVGMRWDNLKEYNLARSDGAGAPRGKPPGQRQPVPQ